MPYVPDGLGWVHMEGPGEALDDAAAGRSSTAARPSRHNLHRVLHHTNHWPPLLLRLLLAAGPLSQVFLLRSPPTARLCRLPDG